MRASGRQGSCPTCHTVRPVGIRRCAALPLPERPAIPVTKPQQNRNRFALQFLPTLPDTGHMTFTDPTAPRYRAKRQAAITAAVDKLPSASAMRENLLQTIATADAATEAEGQGWYGNAHGIAADLATTYGFTVRQTAGVIAALSPQTGWADNVRLATDACRHASVGRTDRIGGHTHDACRKASAILQGADPATVLGGRKVRSFYRNILTPSRPGAVTVDRHAIDMLCGRRGAVNDRVLERIGAYTLAAAVFRSVARELDMTPSACQATAWVAWRKTHDVAWRHDLTDL